MLGKTPKKYVLSFGTQRIILEGKEALSRINILILKVLGKGGSDINPIQSLIKTSLRQEKDSKYKYKALIHKE